MVDRQMRVHEIAEKILEGYGENWDINQTNPTNSLEWHLVIATLLKIQKILFPGPGHMTESSVEMVSTLNSIVENLSSQIALVLGYLPEYKSVPDEERLQAAEEYTLKLMDKIPEIRAMLELDLEAFFEGDPAAFNKDEIVYSYPGLQAIMYYRIAHELYLMNIPIIPRIFTEYGHNVTGVDIHPGATIGKYFFIDHATGVVIGETTIIGDHVKIYQGVTLGGLSTRGGRRLNGVRRHPTIGNNVTIYSGASILGGDTIIGDNCVVGGNVFLTHSIPPDTKISVKSQELHVRTGKPGAPEMADADNDEN